MMPAVAASLHLRGFKLTSDWLTNNSLTMAKMSTHNALSAERISLLVDIVARRHPVYRATCLPQSLVLWNLLRSNGYLAELRIGVGKNDGEFAAHAWVELEGSVINDLLEVVNLYSPIELPPSFGLPDA